MPDKHKQLAQAHTLEEGGGDTKESPLAVCRVCCTVCTRAGGVAPRLTTVARAAVGSMRLAYFSYNEM